MASISVGDDNHGQRALNHTLPLVPFIDFMVCLIAFLMVTAVWTQMSRMNVSGRAPGDAAGLAPEPKKELHLVASPTGFDLRWQQGPTVLETEHVPRIPVPVAGELRFQGLTEAITRQWQAQGEHRGEVDPTLDRAVLHVPNDVPFSEVVAVLDALHAPRRGRVSAFDVTFASN